MFVNVKRPRSSVTVCPTIPAVAGLGHWPAAVTTVARTAAPGGVTRMTGRAGSLRPGGSDPAYVVDVMHSARAAVITNVTRSDETLDRVLTTSPLSARAHPRHNWQNKTLWACWE